MKKYLIGLIVIVVVVLISIIVIIKNGGEDESSFGRTDYPINYKIFDNWHSNTASISCNADDDIVYYAADVYASLSVDERVEFVVNSGMDMAEGFNYFVKTASEGYGFEIASTSGGTAFDITTNCAGGEAFYQKKKGVIVDATGYAYHSVFVAATEQPTVTFKFVASIQDAEPDFLSSPSATNRWERVDINDVQTQTSIDGDTGLSFTGTADYRMFDIYGNAYKWLSVIIDSVTSAAFTIDMQLNN